MEELNAYPYIPTLAFLAGVEHQGDAMLPVLQELAAAGADVFAVEESTGMSALHGAVFAGARETMQWLEQQGLSRTALDKLGRTLSMIAAMGGQLEMLKELTPASADLLVQDVMGQGLHLYAAQGGSLPCLEYLEERGLDVTVPGAKNGGSPLIAAAYSGSIPCVEFFLNKGIDIHVSFKDGVNALMYAAWGGQPEMLSYLMSKGMKADYLDKEGNSALHHAAFGGHVEVLKMLCEAGLDVNLANGSTKMTPLMISARRGYVSAVEYLLSQGADKNARDINGLTAADYAHLIDILTLLEQ